MTSEQEHQKVGHVLLINEKIMILEANKYRERVLSNSTASLNPVFGEPCGCKLYVPVSAFVRSGLQKWRQISKFYTEKKRAIEQCVAFALLCKILYYNILLCIPLSKLVNFIAAAIETFFSISPNFNLSVSFDKFVISGETTVSVLFFSVSPKKNLEYRKNTKFQQQFYRDEHGTHNMRPETTT